VAEYIFIFISTTHMIFLGG